MSTLGSTSPVRVLSGWKEVAKYLRSGVRTVQRYERELGLPIRHPLGKKRGSISADVTELDAWVYAKPIRTSFTGHGCFETTVADLREALVQNRRLREMMSMSQAELARERTQLHAQVQSLVLEAGRLGKTHKHFSTVP
jgi:hypothetical protein